MSTRPSELYLKLVDFLSENLSHLEAKCDELVGTAGSHEETAVVLERSASFFYAMHDREQVARQEALNDFRKLVE